MAEIVVGRLTVAQSLESWQTTTHIHAHDAYAGQELLPKLLLTATSAFTYSFVSSTFKSGMNLTTFPSFLACFLSLSLATSYDRREEDILLE